MTKRIDLKVPAPEFREGLEVRGALTEDWMYDQMLVFHSARVDRGRLQIITGLWGHRQYLQCEALGIRNPKFKTKIEWINEDFVTEVPI